MQKEHDRQTAREAIWKTQDQQLTSQQFRMLRFNYVFCIHVLMSHTYVSSLFLQSCLHRFDPFQQTNNIYLSLATNNKRLIDWLSKA